MAKASTGLRTYLAVTGSIKAALDGGFIKFYDGTVPATADAAATGTLLWTVSVSGAGTGLTIDSAAVNGAAVKPSGATWSGATTAGTPTYYRFVTAADDGTLSTTQRRIQDTCGNTAGVGLYLTNPTLTTDASATAKSLADWSANVLEG